MAKKKWYDRYKDPMTVEFISGVLKMHPADCVFELNAPQHIYDRLKHQSHMYWVGCGARWLSDEADRRLKELKAAFVASEIYCPHEGVDRRAECGVEA